MRATSMVTREIVPTRRPADGVGRGWRLTPHNRGMTLREVLHAHIPTLSPESTVRDAVDKMDVYQFPALVIVDAEAVPVGVVTEGDLCRAATRRDSLVTMA